MGRLEPRRAAFEREQRSPAQARVGRLEPLAAALEDPARAAAEAGVRAVEGGAELGEIRHDEAPGDRRRRGAHVGGEVDERRVLLVADRGDDRHGAGGDGAHEALVRERQQILEAAAAAGDDDHVGSAPAELA